MTPTLPSLPNISITPIAVWVAFSIVVTVWTAMTVILTYHWKTYSVGTIKTAFMKFIYFVGSAFFLIIIFLAALTFSLQW